MGDFPSVKIVTCALLTLKLLEPGVGNSRVKTENDAHRTARRLQEVPVPGELYIYPVPKTRLTQRHLGLFFRKYVFI